MGYNRDHRRAEEAVLATEQDCGHNAEGNNPWSGWIVLAEGSHTGFQRAGDMKISKESWIPTDAYSLLRPGLCEMGD